MSCSLEGNAHNAHDAVTLVPYLRLVPFAGPRSVCCFACYACASRSLKVTRGCTCAPSHASSKAVDRPAATGMPTLVDPLARRDDARSAVLQALGRQSVLQASTPHACFGCLSLRVGPESKAKSDRVELRWPFEGPTCREIQRNPLACHPTWSQVQRLCTFGQTPNLQRVQFLSKSPAGAPILCHYSATAAQHHRQFKQAPCR